MRRAILILMSVFLILGASAATQASAAVELLHHHVHHSLLDREHRFAARIGKYARGKRQMLCLDKLWNRESGWNAWAVNQYSGAYGIPQALGHGNVYPLGKYRPQIRWGIRAYIKPVYSTPCAAWRHELADGWY